MQMNPPSDGIVQELAALRDLIRTHDNVQILLDLSAEEADRRADEKARSVRLAWRVAGGAGIVALGAMIVALGAVRTSMRPAPAPEVLVVDKASGVVQPLISLASFQMDPLEATIRRNVNTFLLARESYSYGQADPNYYTAAAFMSPQLQTQWGQMWAKENPDSPIAKYKKESVIRVEVGAITLLRNGYGAPIGARASFTRQELKNDLAAGPPTSWIGTIIFHWVNQPMNERERRINDLGWEVTEYTVDRDVVDKPAVGTRPVPQATQAVHAAPMALVAPADTRQVTP